MPAIETHCPTILVTDAGLGSAVAIIRSLGRQGWRVIAADSTADAPGLHSRFAWRTLVYPSPKNDPAAFVNTIKTATCRSDTDLILPVTDMAILPLQKERKLFEPACRIAIPESNALEQVTNKEKTLELARSLGIPVPATKVVATVVEADIASQDMTWPVVLKPRASRTLTDKGGVDFFTVCYARDTEDLRRNMQRFEGQCSVLLQEYCAGIGVGVEVLMSRGRPLAAFQHKRLREMPISGGASALRESVRLDETLYDASVRMLSELNWTGLAMVEFKVGDRGPRLMEINGRVWGSLPLAVRSGMDFPKRLVDLYLCGEPDWDEPVCTSYRVGVRCRNLGLDTAWILTVLSGRKRYPFLPTPSRKAGFAALAQMLDLRVKNDILVLDDPKPGWFEMRQVARKTWAKRREEM